MKVDKGIELQREGISQKTIDECLKIRCQFDEFEKGVTISEKMSVKEHQNFRRLLWIKFLDNKVIEGEISHYIKLICLREFIPAYGKHKGRK